MSFKDKCSEKRGADRRNHLQDDPTGQYTQGSLMTAINRIGNAVLIELMFFICSIPIVTFGASLSAFYYAMMKSVRCERSYPLKEFFSAFKRSLLKGILYTVLSILLIALLIFNIIYADAYAAAYTAAQTAPLMAVYIILLVFAVAFTLWIFPVISRFRLDFKRTVVLTFTIAVKRFYFTLALAALSAAGIWLIMKLSVGFTLVVPAAVCYLSTYLIEPAFRTYIPKPEANEDAWYYDGH